jgi:serine/threonine-protein kinase
MASVWIARQRGKHGFEKLVAIKTILPKFAEDLRFQQMFLDEARIASRIEHANVAQIHDLGEEHGILFLAMEWIDGDALSKLRAALERRGRLIPPAIALRILADTCGGLHAAHELRGGDGALLGVVHRDVSPQNILVSVRGMAKLIDFGIAKARDRVADETNAGLIKGKIQYMSPEQAMGNDVDRRADVWAVGAIIYHLLAGRPPYEGDNQLATLHLLTSGNPPAPLPSSVHPEIAAVVRRSLAHDPAKRFATAEQMQEAIELAMSEARLVATAADVAAFVNEHMADRALARKEAIDIAVNAAQERARVEALLQPARDSISPMSARAPAAAPTRPELPPSPFSAPTATFGAASTSSLSGIPLSAMNAESEATLGSAALVAPLRPRRGSMAVLAAALGIALLCAIGLIVFLASRESRATSAARPAPSAIPTVIASTAAPTAPATASAPTASASTATISADALPSATAAKPQWAPFVPRATAAPTAAPQKKSIDDGF